jgi:hypothetical protein|tara:strand:+ start:106 stop:570 length:465 start_codon:yes stop_codon:yes gene_type:complete
MRKLPRWNDAWVKSAPIDGLPAAAYMDRFQKILAEEFYQKIPDYMIPSFYDYFFLGKRPGDFLQSLLGNDLLASVSTADDGNLNSLREWMLFLYNHTHSHCYGSRQNINDWCYQRLDTAKYDQAVDEYEQLVQDHMLDDLKRDINAIQKDDTND